MGDMRMLVPVPIDHPSESEESESVSSDCKLKLEKKFHSSQQHRQAEVVPVLSLEERISLFEERFRQQESFEERFRQQEQRIDDLQRQIGKNLFEDDLFFDLFLIDRSNDVGDKRARLHGVMAVVFLILIFLWRFIKREEVLAYIRIVLAKSPISSNFLNMKLMCDF
jgi:hypothetical protein